MSAIIDFFNSCLDTLLSVVEILVNLIQSIVWFITYLPDLVDGISAAFAYTPGFLFPFLSAAMALYVVFAVIRLF